MPGTKSGATRKPTAKAAVTVGTELPFAPRRPARPFLDAEKASVDKTRSTLANIRKLYKAPPAQSPSNVVGDPTQNLQKFTLQDLAPFTKEATYSTDASKDVHLFYVGRDDVHDILKYILSRVTISLYLNMFGYDDQN
jgi:hypothetical protein